MLIYFIIWYFIHLFCFGWLHDWHHARSGISDADYQAYLDDYEANTSKGKSKLQIWLSDTLPGGRKRHRWCREHAADPAVYDRLLWVIRLAELPALLFGIWFLLAFWSDSLPPDWSYIPILGIMAYDVILLLLGMRWRRSSK